MFARSISRTLRKGLAINSLNKPNLLNSLYQKNAAKLYYSSFRDVEHMDDSALYQLTTEETVSNLVQNASINTKPAVSKYVLNCFMQDEPGILARCAGIMAARGYNIDSLVVAKTEVLGLSRMTITIKGAESQMIQAQKELEEIPQIWAVVNLTGSKVVAREILLAKVSLIGPDFKLDGANSHTPRAPSSTNDAEKTTETENISTSDTENNGADNSDIYQMVLDSSKRLSYLKEITSLYNAKIVDVGADSAVVELSAKPSIVNAFMSLIEPFGIFEAARSGQIVMSRTAKLSFFSDGVSAQAEDDVKDVDLSHLPPS
ncbi:putative acetolactate synthase small subunit [Zancudomyces culisetae]|uniref:Putative acetolactate synthase small subunit n=1 Tax=Zancudomyces culisetae TaxID=1213189 RepID=A0A1R1PWE0_ZANCU|nr:putative acetolactate synthase small subunit [Zancudomyces culisetae]|eukprot:OMH85212.1 putative acetolactate synthase small subunit [Zancudomyces culisetae]